jgi:hypothetical protein
MSDVVEAVLPESVETEGSEEVVEQQAAPTPEQKAEIKRINKLRLKVDGNEYDEQLPFDIDDDPKKIEWLTKNLQLSKSASKRAEERNNLQKEVSAFIEELRSNPRKVLSDKSLGVDLKKIAQEILEEEIANSQKSPQELEKEKLEAELKAIKDEREKEKKLAQERELQSKYEQEVERYDMKINKALETAKLPKSAYTVKKMAEYLSLAIENNLNLDPEDITGLVEDEMRNDFRQLVSVLPEDVIEDYFGKEAFNKVRKKKLAKAPPTPLKKAVTDVGTKSQAKPIDNNQSFKDFFKL